MTIQTNSGKYPLWFKGTIILLGMMLLFMLISYGRFILMPLALSSLLAMLLQPLSVQIERLKVGRTLAIIFSMLIVFMVLSTMFSLLSIQIVQFAGQLPEVSDKLQSLSSELLAFFQRNFRVSPEQQIDFLQNGLENIINKSGQYISAALGATTSVFTTLSILPFFVFFMMYYKDMYRTFLYRLWKGDKDSEIDEIITNVQNVTQNYIIGMITVITILAILNGIGLLMIGLDHAVFFAIFSAVLAVIPYIGIIIGSLPAILYAVLFTNSLWNPLAVIGVFAVVQFLEGNLITPNVIGSRVSINPFMALIALIIGGQLWGITGMILFVPFVGIFRCIFSEIETLKPYAYLLGNEINYTEKKGSEGD